jgi:hypothetical protein
MLDDKPLDMTDAARSDCLDRIGMAKLAKLAFDGADLRPMWAEVSARLLNGEADAGEGIDLSLVAQLLGHKETGLSIQQEVLASRRLFRLPCLSQTPRMRVLALAAASDDCGDALRKIEAARPRWPRPLLNPPQRIGNLDRDKLHRLLAGIEGLVIPATIPCARAQLGDAIESTEAPQELAGTLVFPVIIRPRGSHAGVGLAKIDDVPAMRRYLDQSEAEEFFVARFVDYASEDGLFRKYRVVFVDGKPYACHMAVADRWDIWYLNAGMSGDAGKRLEEATFMSTFDIAFARRHRSVLAAMAERVGLDYFIVDCAETRDGSLLIFEADNTAVVHNMDQPEVFPYKPAQMRKIFDAFVAMLERRVAQAREQAA